MSTTPLQRNNINSKFPEERRLATVLFADVQGFTSLAEQLDFETVSYLIKGIWDRLDKVIESHGGYIDKHLGDGVMAVWGAPYAGDTDAEAAITAGLALQHAMTEFTQQVNIQKAESLKLRVGINSGSVFAGYVGTKEEYTVIGDTVNVAHRLEESAAVGTVVISENTHRLVRGLFTMKQLEPVIAKGKTDPVEAFEVVSKLAPVRHTRNTESLETRMVGRDTEFARIKNFFEQSQHTSAPLMVLVMGEVGIGKTRLINEFSTSIEAEENILIIPAKGSPQSSRTPFQLWHEIICKYFDLDDSLPTDELSEIFEKKASQLWSGPSGSEAAHLTGHVIGLRFPESPFLPDTEGNGFQQHAFPIIREFISRMSKTKPFMLLIDDLQWVDRESTQLLSRVAEKELRPLKLFILAGARPDFLRENPHWRNSATVIALGPLSISSETVATAYPDLESMPRQLLVELAARSEGNPYFLGEIVKGLMKSGLDELKKSPNDALAKLKSQIPESLRATLQARLDNLPRDARTVVLLAAVSGRVFWVGSVNATARANTGTGTLSNMPPPVMERLIQDGLRQLVRSEIIFPRSGSEYAPRQEYVFKNSFLCDVAYSLIPVRSRAMYHKAVAQWLAGQDDMSFHLMSAEHFEQAGAFSDAAIQYEKAAKMAHDRRAKSEAQALEDSATIARQKAKETENAQQFQ